MNRLVDDLISVNEETETPASDNTENLNTEAGKLTKEPGPKNQISVINPETHREHHVSYKCIDQRDVRNEDVTEEPVGPSRPETQSEGYILFHAHLNVSY